MHPYIPIIIPGLFGFGAASFCNIESDSGEVVRFRPPSWVFSVMWPILYLLLGLSWYTAKQSIKRKNEQLIDVVYFLLVVLLCLWIFIYSCQGNKKEAILVLILCIAVLFMIFALAPLTSKLLICPLIAWIIFATIMNCFEVQDSVKESIE